MPQIEQIDRDAAAALYSQAGKTFDDWAAAFAAQREAATIAELNRMADYLDGYAGGHHMAKSCASALRERAATLAEIETVARPDDSAVGRDVSVPPVEADRRNRARAQRAGRHEDIGLPVHAPDSLLRRVVGRGHVPDGRRDRPPRHDARRRGDVLEAVEPTPALSAGGRAMTFKYCNHGDCRMPRCADCPYSDPPSRLWVAVWNWGDDQSLRSNTLGADYARRDFSVRGTKDWHGNKTSENRRPDYIIHVHLKPCGQPAAEAGL